MGGFPATFPASCTRCFWDLDQGGQPERWKQIDLPLVVEQRFSINVISWLGDDFAMIPEVAGGIVDEEPFLTVTLPRRLGRPPRPVHEALFAHYAFFTQRPRLEWSWPSLMDHYTALAQQRRSAPSLGERAVTLWRRHGLEIRQAHPQVAHTHSQALDACQGGLNGAAVGRSLGVTIRGR